MSDTYYIAKITVITLIFKGFRNKKHFRSFKYVLEPQPSKITILLFNIFFMIFYLKPLSLWNNTML